MQGPGNIPHEHAADSWMACTLCRSVRQGRHTLSKARQRQIDWPQVKEYSHSQNPVQDPTIYTTIDDAFASILQCMSTTSKQCKRFYKSCSPEEVQGADHTHCNRFHTPEYTKVQHNNPLQMAEDVHLVVHPGTYAVTAGEWGKSQQQTHVVHVQQGNSVNLDFVM